jgi:hypothetical protein
MGFAFEIALASRPRIMIRFLPARRRRVLQPSVVMTSDHQIAVAVALLIGFVFGFAVGYGLRAFISFRHRKAARRARRW